MKKKKKPMKSFITATQARQHFFQLIEQAEKPGAAVTITVESEPRVVMMSVEEFEGWKETLEIMADSDLVKRIAEGLQDISDGNLYTSEEIKRKFNS